MVIYPVVWKDRQCACITLTCLKEEREKLQMLNLHANELSSYFQVLISKYEQQLSSHRQQAEEKDFETDVLLNLHKMFNEFLFMKNIIEIDGRNIKQENEMFELK